MEVYSTGRAKCVLATTHAKCCSKGATTPVRTICVCVCVHSLPGSRTERSLLESFSRMLPELLRFSSSARLLHQIPESLQAVHRSGTVRVLSAASLPPPLSAKAAYPAEDNVEEEEDEDGDGEEPQANNGVDDFDDAALAALGL